MPSRRAFSLQLGATVAIAAMLGAATASHAEPASRGEGRDLFLDASGISLSSAQIAAFADLVGESPAVVEQRLLWRPDLAPYAAAAGAKRLARKNTGKSMTIAGFTLLGAGSTIGFFAALSGTCFGLGEECQARKAQADRTGEVIVLASAGLGLLLAIPGIVMMARQSDTETQAMRLYRNTETTRPDVFPANTSRSLAPARGLSVPLLSATF